MRWDACPAVRSLRTMPSEHPHRFTVPTVREIRPLAGIAQGRAERGAAARSRRLPATCLYQRDRVAASLMRVSQRETGR
jgi:hypothetical protein